jgi:hypothetical protein
MECIDDRDGCEDDVSLDWEKRSTSRDDLSELEGCECDDTTRCDVDGDCDEGVRGAPAVMGGRVGRGFEGAGKGLLDPGTYEAVDVVDEDRRWLVCPEPMDTLVPG